MLDWINSLKTSYEKECARQSASMIAVQKMFEEGNYAIYSKDLSAEFRKMGMISIATFVGACVFARYGMKNNFYRFGLISAANGSLFFWVWPYCMANMIEIVAEDPMEYGQIIRAVMIFKNPKGQKTKYYEELSEKYRHYSYTKNTKKEF
ncbi:hypothetical protein SteCoe_29570 [Stentor coeruleus]|uniref:Uncharacterized protein n=1 Tax=Stentor coeruleus TaxID=5963 RepID=A0A1R2B5J9_9CILI|nr:hypothetical protein SteCoe_29570 [Stentor coeruleus]